jgi:hypothetical protein
MKRAAMIIGAVLILAGAFLLLEGLNVLHGGPLSGKVMWAGWGAWGVAFGVGFLVWSRAR